MSDTDSDSRRAGRYEDRIPVNASFLVLSRLAPILTQPPVQRAPGLPRGKADEAWC